MTKPQLKAHCEDVIANPQDHQDWVVDMAKEALAAITQLASPALKLPDAVIPSVHLNSNAKSVADSARNGGKIDGWNLCFAEIVRLNAPHTAPKEPICATGGAEWVKLEDELPKDGSWCIAIEEGDFAGDVVYWGNGEWRSEFGRDEYTHWMYHPAAPES